MGKIKPYIIITPMAIAMGALSIQALFLLPALLDGSGIKTAMFFYAVAEY